LKATFADGVRDVVLKFDRAEGHAAELELHLHDVGLSAGSDSAIACTRHDLIGGG
jgi:hypothetical protein